MKKKYFLSFLIFYMFLSNCFAQAPCNGSFSESINGLSVYFSPNYYGDSLSTTTHFWSFGDGSSSSMANPTHTYNQCGTYSILHTVSTRDSNRVYICSDSIMQNIVIICNPPPSNCNIIPQLIIDSTLSNSYIFVNTTNSIGAATWVFSDSTTATGDSVIHTFRGSAPYSVCMRITESNNCYADTCVTISNGGTVNNCTITPRLIIDSIASNSYIFVNITPSFGTVSWIFSDSTTASGDSIIHTFRGSAPYSVCMRITESNNCYADTCVTIRNGGTVNNCNITPRLIIDSIASNSYIFVNITPSFGTVSWIFSDSTTASGDSIIHTFRGSAPYSVCMRITESNNCYADTCVTIRNGGTVNNCNIFPQFIIDSIASNSYIFVNTTNSIGTATWIFSDSTTATGDTVIHTFSGSAPYSVRMRIAESNTCYADTCVIIRTNNNPNVCNLQSNFRWQATVGNVNEINFTNTITGLNSNTDILTWTFGDGSLSHDLNPIHQYVSSRVLNVCLSVERDSTCISNRCHTLSNATPLTSFPNPAQGTANVNVLINQAAQISAFLYNSQSVLVGQVSQSGVAGNNLISFNIAGLPVGFYTIRMYSGNQVYVSRFQKL